MPVQHCTSGKRFITVQITINNIQARQSAAMRYFTYELPVLPVTGDLDHGVDNPGFQDCTLTSVTGIKATPDQPAELSKGQVLGENKDKDTCPEDEGDNDIYCGIGSCRPPCVQGCKNMACFTVLYSVIGLVMAALSSYINSQITTLEKHFNLSSSVSGFLMACDDLGFLLTTLFASYYTRRVHIPRVLTLSSILYGVAGIFCAVAFFGTRDQIPSPPLDTHTGGNILQTSAQTGFTQMCQNFTIPANESCITVSSHSKGVFEITEAWRIAAICIIAIGMILQGVTKSPRQTFLGIYVDDNVPKTKTSIYLGITTGITIFGPGVAYAVGGIVSSLYITLEDTSISPRDPRWLGAWWLGFLVFGGAALVVSIPLLFFPKRMRRQKRPQPIQEKIQVEKKGCYRLWVDLKGILKDSLHLVINPVFMSLTFATSLGILIVSGIMAFQAKYMETQFTIAASQANILIGAVTFTAAPLGTIVGGFVTSRFKLSPQACLKFLLICRVIDFAVSCLGFIFGCDQPTLHTATHIDSSGYETTSQCLQDCNCDDQKYFPICGSDGNSYFSPCNAGCVSMNNQLFTNCTCMNMNSTQTATGGLCQPDCNMLYAYLLISAVTAFFSAMSIMPAFIATIRSVKEEEKPLAIGWNGFVSSALGWFPGPVIYGALVDSTCMMWKTTCSAVGACTLYDIELFRFRYIALSTGLRGVVIVLYVAALLYAVCCSKFVFQPHRDNITKTVTVGQKEDTKNCK